ncbi:Plexin-B [Gryllus bimaculatus]|nr:Plexin-B [Gryllus bimaculatus]
MRVRTCAAAAVYATRARPQPGALRNRERGIVCAPGVACPLLARSQPPAQARRHAAQRLRCVSCVRYEMLCQLLLSGRKCSSSDWIFNDIPLAPFRVFKVKVQECSVYTTCWECLGAKDPYCGWCSLENNQRKENWKRGGLCAVQQNSVAVGALRLALRRAGKGEAGAALGVCQRKAVCAWGSKSVSC